MIRLPVGPDSSIFSGGWYVYMESGQPYPDRPLVHNGIDIARNPSAAHAPVYAVDDGIIRMVYKTPGDNGIVELESHSMIFGYVHVGEIQVKLGQYVKRGDTLAHVNPEADHLHFDIRFVRTPPTYEFNDPIKMRQYFVDPHKWLKDRMRAVEQIFEDFKKLPGGLPVLIEYDTADGHKKYVLTADELMKSVEAPTYKVNVAVLNVGETPMISATNIIGKLTYGSLVKIGTISNGWGQIAAGLYTGNWVSMGYLVRS